MNDNDQTSPTPGKFDPSVYPENLLIHERRTKKPDPSPTVSPSQPKERRRRVDPTTFEKQYTIDEIEFMNAMQQFKSQSGHPFPTYDEVLRVAARLGYRKLEPDSTDETSANGHLNGESTNDPLAS
ncbi:hypothetical protein ACYOEI_32635 [Singulisphaera rosea]